MKKFLCDLCSEEVYERPDSPSGTMMTMRLISRSFGKAGKEYHFHMVCFYRVQSKIREAKEAFLGITLPEETGEH